MPFELHIALRYLLAKRKQAFISVILLISTLGVTVGVMALVIALALMTGLQGELRDRILGSNPHIFVWKRSGMADYRAEAEKRPRIAVVAVAIGERELQRLRYVVYVGDRVMAHRFQIEAGQQRQQEHDRENRVGQKAHNALAAGGLSRVARFRASRGTVHSGFGPERTAKAKAPAKAARAVLRIPTAARQVLAKSTFATAVRHD